MCICVPVRVLYLCMSLAHPHTYTHDTHSFIHRNDVSSAERRAPTLTLMNSTRFVIHTHLLASSSVFSTGEAVCPHARHWASSWLKFVFVFSYLEFRIFLRTTNDMSSPTAVQPPPPVKPPPTPPTVGASAGKGVSSKVYNGIIGFADKFVPAKLRPLWVHPAGDNFFG